MTGLVDRLGQGPALLLDGGLGSMLIARGLGAGTPPEAWNRDNPEAVTEVHRKYVEAGSEAIHSNTFGANPIRLAAYGLAEAFEEVNAAAVRLARAAGPSFVLGDMGPTGQYLPPVGSGDTEAWSRAFEQQARVLVDSGVDGIHIETMSDLREAEAALRAALAVAGDLPVLVSMTFERKKRGFFTVFGDKPKEALTGLAGLGAAVVGANCSLASADMAELAGAISAQVPAKLGFQPNAGAPEQKGQEVIYAQKPEDFASDVAKILSLGARVVGGCCGTDPQFIKELAGVVGP